MSSNDPTYRLATSYHTIINIEFINGTGGLLTNFSAFIDKRDGDGFNSIPFLVQKADLPNIKSTIKDGIVTPFGFISVTSNQPVIPEQNSFKIHFFNTEFSIMENFLAEWISETVSNVWLYREYPFSKANITVSFFDQSINKIIYAYKFYECFPSRMTTQNVSYDIEIPTNREAEFVFDYMNIIVLNKEYLEAPVEKPKEESKSNTFEDRSIIQPRSIKDNRVRSTWT
jgi:hypothetical protein